MKRRFSKTCLATAVLLLAAGLCPAEVGQPVPESKRQPKNDKEDVSKIGDRGVGKAVNFYSLEKEIQLGKQLAADVERNAKIVDDPVIAEYVNRIGQNIVNNSDAKVPFTIKVIDSDEVNAFALPGGYFFVNTGLIELAQSEAELAGVMAHEIAHVAARHGTRSATRAQLVQYASIPLLFIGGWAGYGIQQAANFAIPMTMLKFSREFEHQADFLGVQYLYKAGYDPAAMVQFFERLKAMQKRNKNAIAKAFSSHPLTKSRIKAVQKTIDQLLPEQPEYAVSSSEFDDVKVRLAKLNARRKPAERDPNRPTLRRSASDEPILPSDIENDPVDPANDQDERPKLKRRSVS
ncbi:MAG: M48 family metalloprotease [Acidobacteriia bacterium]|nr:M48 family metalloprotease [Terriglobia bacterium]